MTTVLSGPTRTTAPTRRHVVVVGAGVTGLVAAVQAVTNGHRVTVMDRGAIPDEGSTSFDRHRVIRALDPGDLQRSRRDAGLVGHWLDLESRLCTRGSAGFVRRTGVVTGWSERDLRRGADCARQAGIAIRQVSASELPELGLPPGAHALRETAAGVILADRALIAAARWLESCPEATLLPGTPVTHVDSSTGTVSGAGGPLVRGDLTLVACGPWSGSLVDVPTQVHRQTMVHLRPPPRLRDWWLSAPVVARVGRGARAWVVPAIGGSDIKVSTDDARRSVSSIDWQGDADESDWCRRVLDSGAVHDMGAYDVTSIRRCHYATSDHSDALGLVRLGPTLWARVASGPAGFRSAPLAAAQVLRELQPAIPTRTPRTGRKAT